MKPITKINFYYREGMKEAKEWEQKILKWLNKEYPAVKDYDKDPQAIIVLGGDGTILEAVKKFQNKKVVFLGLNLGGVGFLASVREPEKFFEGLKKFFDREYWLDKRMMIKAFVYRNGKDVFASEALNEVVIQNPLGMVEIEARIDGRPIQSVRGTGVLIASPTGSTAYNLSAHGPIVSPGIRAMIMTEILDHNIPTPSLIIKDDEKLSFKIEHFRPRELLFDSNGQAVEVMIVTDGENIFPLTVGDQIVIEASEENVNFVELEKNYFFKSLREKFEFR